MKPALALLVAASVAIICGPLAYGETRCADITKMTFTHAQIVSATQEDLGAGMTACRISVISRPTADSDIHIEVWIPRGAAWNGKYLQVGNGGFAGSIPTRHLRLFAARGYAVAGTDDGHQTRDGTDASWALNHPEKVVDFGWRALKETTVISKALIVAQKATLAKKSYFYGCSDGGREALVEAQRYPDDFDGIVAGAPANYLAELLVLGASNAQATSKPGAFLGEPQLQLLQKASIAACGGGKFIRDPAHCRFDPGTLACKKGQKSDCLTPAQLTAAKAIYSGRRDPHSGKIVFPGFSPGGEADKRGWRAWITGPTPGWPPYALGPAFATNGLRYFAFADPKYNIAKLGMGVAADQAIAKMAPQLDAAYPDLSVFKKHGGKLIQYHGWNDPAIPTHSSIRYYKAVHRAMGDVSAFYRLYLVPGMLHCGGGAGPSHVDWLGLLDNWVTKNHAPAAVVATSGPGLPGTHTVAAQGSQLLCPYPQVAKLIRGDPDNAASYRCVKR